MGRGGDDMETQVMGTAWDGDAKVAASTAAIKAFPKHDQHTCNIAFGYSHIVESAKCEATLHYS